MIHDDALARAIAACPTEDFHGPDGRAIRPCTPADVTRRHVRMLAPRPGANLLEIGVGSGYSGALLAHLAGPTGHVTAVEYNPELAERAARLFAEHQLPVTVITGDGMPGHAERAPYDGIFVGATPPAIPHAWLAQLRPGGKLLTGVRISDLPGSYAIACLTVDDKAQPDRIEVHHGGYTPMAPLRPVTELTRAEHDGASVTAMGSKPAEQLLSALTSNPYAEPNPATGDDYFHFKNWLLATRADGLLEAALPQGVGVGIGISNPGGAVHAALVTDELLISDAPVSPARAMLQSLAAEWERRGAPRTHQLRAFADRDGDTWAVRLDT
ncbi:protein-L-isoaspartate O-methyltransferase family protein [Streptomyces sp. CA-250714]|uniref:protein-L-isoaspartate O-methyltransferase family protein n=1 Tax=Streptomyces sp. CA-250714 TaxID=3240060 RepID=UPI003D943FD7